MIVCDHAISPGTMSSGDHNLILLPGYENVKFSFSASLKEMIKMCEIMRKYFETFGKSWYS